MSILSNPLSNLLMSRTKWLSARAGVLADNVSRADMTQAFRRDIKPFRRIMSEQSKSPYTHGSFRIRDDDVVKTKQEINREMEMLEVTNNATEYDAMLALMKRLTRMVQIVGGKMGGG